ncbi:MAG: hypothetical protein LWX11_03760 [Firmicutes bacterium]|nr:hypothetical protein [Bacillota bacterium]
MSLSLPFETGQCVVLVLREPRERLWGRLLGLEAAGVALRGVDLNPWEEILSLVRQGQGESVSLSTRFYPMHRVETFYLDEATSGVPSLGEQFETRTGVAPHTFLADR